jgi:hypothetical protein
MNTTKYTKLFDIKKITLIVFIMLSLVNIVSAADSYLYSVDGKEYGDPSTGFRSGYATKAACETDRATTGAGRIVSPECYKSFPVTIKSVSTTEIPIKGQVLVAGTNLIGVTSVTIGTVSATFYPSYKADGTTDGTSLRVVSNPGTTGGKITIKTEYRGQVISAENIKITNTTDSRWWFTNTQKQIMGPDGGYTTLAACQAAKADYNKNNGVTTGDTSCASGTLTDWQKEKSGQKPLGSTEDPAVNISPSKAITVSDEYTLLAPIGSLTTFNSRNIGEYFNMMFMLAIGLCAALAVIMIVISAIQYMGTESIFGKTEAKGKIFSAILGLLIALGSYAILNTISPDLTGVNGLTVDQASIEVDAEPMTADDPVPTGARTTHCTEGIDTINKPPSCKTITSKIQGMLSQARADGYTITGYGFRSKTRQEQLRAQNCGGTSNVYNKNAKCTPLTAIPGTSMHESGLAFDLQCDGASIRSRANRCFIWLQKNASKYGLKNLAAEPWHWSTTGH